MSTFLTIVVIHALAVMSPGPDFVIVTRNSLAYSRRTGVFTSLGVAIGLMVHVVYCLLGIGLLISQSIIVFNIIKYIGAAYLIYIGWKALTAKKEVDCGTTIQKRNDISLLKAFKHGFLCNVLNPKATLFIFALFTQLIDPTTPLALQAFYGAYMGVATFVWFAFLASVLSLAAIKNMLRSFQHTMERIMGAVLMALGVKIAITSQE